MHLLPPTFRAIRPLAMTAGAGVVVADLPIIFLPSPYVRHGDWPILALAACAVIAGLAMGRKKKPAAESAPQG